MRLAVAEGALTPYGGLVPWVAFTKHLGVAEGLAEAYPGQRTSPNAAPVYDVIQSFLLTAVTVADSPGSFAFPVQEHARSIPENPIPDNGVFGPPSTWRPPLPL